MKPTAGYLLDFVVSVLNEAEALVHESFNREQLDLGGFQNLRGLGILDCTHGLVFVASYNLKSFL